MLLKMVLEDCQSLTKTTFLDRGAAVELLWTSDSGPVEVTK